MIRPSERCTPICDRDICLGCDAYRIYYFDSVLRTTTNVVAENRVLLKQVIFLKEELVKALENHIDAVQEGDDDE